MATTKQLLAKADMALADLANGGRMQPEQMDNFVRIMSNEATILNDVRLIQMGRPKMNVNKLKLGERVLRPANQGTITSPLSGEEGTRALSRADRVKVSTSMVELDTFEVIAEVNLPYEVLEDNIEGGQIDNTRFQETVLTKIAEQVRIDIEDAIISGDTASVDTFLQQRDGVLKQAVSNIVNNGGSALDATTFNEMMQALPDQFKRVMNRYKFYVSPNKRLEYMMEVAQRQTGLGDAVLVAGDGQNFAPFGVPLVGAASMPSSQALLIDPTNIMFGVQRNMRIEFDRDTRERVIIIVFTMRFDFKLEQEDMVVKATNLA